MVKQLNTVPRLNRMLNRIKFLAGLDNQCPIGSVKLMAKTKTNCTLMKPNELLEEWLAGIRINVLAHYECSKLFDAYHRLLGYPTVILSALAGTAFVSTLNDSNYWWARAAAVGLSLAVTVFASLQTFLRYAERSEKHKRAATEFGKLRRELEQMLALLPPDGAVRPSDMQFVRNQWGELSTHAPAIPNRVYTRMFLKVWHKAAGTGQPPTAP